jgi:hypothetical protein
MKATCRSGPSGSRRRYGTCSLKMGLNLHTSNANIPNGEGAHEGGIDGYETLPRKKKERGSGPLGTAGSKKSKGRGDEKRTCTQATQTYQNGRGEEGERVQKKSNAAWTGLPLRASCSMSATSAAECTTEGPNSRWPAAARRQGSWLG